MKHLRLHPVIGVLSFLLLGCATETPLTGPSNGGIYGSWQWVRSVGGIAGTTRTPPPQVRVTYGTDGSYQYLRDSLRTAPTTFRLFREKSPFGAEMLGVIRYQDSVAYQPQAYQVDNDTLRLMDLCIDCFFHTYVRVR